MMRFPGTAVKAGRRRSVVRTAVPGATVKAERRRSVVPTEVLRRGGEGRVDGTVPGCGGEGRADDVVPERFDVEEEQGTDVEEDIWWRARGGGRRGGRGGGASMWRGNGRVRV
jgi:hypothetical protein